MQNETKMNSLMTALGTVSKDTAMALRLNKCTYAFTSVIFN